MSVDYFCILDSFGDEMKKLRNKFVRSSVLAQGDPATAAQGVNVGTNIFNEKFTFLNVMYNSPSKCVYGAIEALGGIKMRQKVHLETNCTDLVQRLQRPK